jgi:hypothetical protein
MSRSQNHFVLLAVLVMLTFALTSLQAQSSAANFAPPIPATNTNAPTRPISDAQFKKLLADVASTNADAGSTDSRIAKAFGVDHPGQSERRDSFVGPDKHGHTFSKLDNGNYIFSTADESLTHSYSYYADKKLVLITAVYATGQGITIIPNKDAQAGLDAELKFFAGIADQL